MTPAPRFNGTVHADAPFVSVIIPVYNGEKYLSDTIKSVQDQTEQSWEIVAVNDGSTDRSLSVLEEIAGTDPSRFTVLSVENAGVSSARNSGIAAARGTYIAFLDQDDLWAPEKLERQIDMLEKDTRIGISFTNEAFIDDSGKMVTEKAIRLDSRHRGDVFETLLFDNFIPISSVMLRKDLLEKTGGFDPRYHLAEDYEFLLRATQAAPVDFIDEPLLLYRQHRDSGTAKKIGRLTAESCAIIDFWRAEKPDLFRRRFISYLVFKGKFSFLKLKVKFF
jgi:glycosyltransferase involved in cell wall biosynthesis